MPELDNEQIRCAISVTTKRGLVTESHIFVGCTNGVLLRLDPVNFFITMKLKLSKHIFCLLQLDEDTILCGQLYGYLDLVSIADGQILFRESLKHKTGTIVSMVKTKARLHEVTLATQKGIFFACIRRGGPVGLRRQDIQKLGDSMPYGRGGEERVQSSTSSALGGGGLIPPTTE